MKKRKMYLSVLLLVLFLVAGAALAGCKGKGEEAAGEPPNDEPSPDELLECLWIIDVDDQVVVDVEGIEFVYNLTLSAEKSGGTDSMGEYTGTAYLTINADFSGLLPAGSPVQLSGGIDAEGRDANAAFAVVPYNVETIEWPQGPPDGPRLAPLVVFDYMAYGTFNMAGMASLDILAEGIQGERAEYSDSSSETAPVGFCISIEGATVYVYIDSVGPAFKGTVTGIPL